MHKNEISPTMQAIITASTKVARGGFVTPENLTTFNSPAEFEMTAGEDVFAMILREAAKAEKQILIQTFGWSRFSKFAADFNELLQKISAERRTQDLPPLKLYILVNQLDRVAQLMFRKTLRCHKIKAPKDIGLIDIPDNIELHLGVYHHNSLGATHAKAVIIDEKAAIVTGANFQTTFYGDKAYHDSAYLLRGPVVKALYDNFRQSWKLRKKHTITDKDIPPFDHTEIKENTENSSAVLCATNKPHALSLLKLLHLQSPLNNPLAVSAHTAINHAQHKIQIAIPNIGAKFIIDALADFVNQRNGTIELLMTHQFNNQREKLYGGTNEKNLQRLIDKIDADKRDHLSVRWFCKNETEKLAEQFGVLHMKLMIIDDQITIFGSANLDQLSFYNAQEENIIVDNKAFAERARDELFKGIYQNGVARLP